MATITNSIGSAGGRDYSTIALWAAALPANVVTSGNSYVGACYNDSEFVISSGITLTNTVDATHTITLTAATGQSFQDAAGIRSNQLKYNQANGVAINLTGGYKFLVDFHGASGNGVIVSRLQVKIASNTTSTFWGVNTGTIRECLIDSAGGRQLIRPSLVANVVIICRAATTNGVMYLSYGGLIIGCMVIRPIGITGSGTDSAYSGEGTGNRLQSSGAFGFVTPCVTATYTGTSKNNATDLSSGLPGTSNQFSVTYGSATPFTSATSGSEDLRAIASTALAANGFLDSTNAPNDISGTARSATPTIGAWELAAAAGIIWSPIDGPIGGFVL